MAIVRKIELVMTMPDGPKVECQLLEAEASLFGHKSWQVVEMEIDQNRPLRPAGHAHTGSRELADAEYDRLVAARIACGFVARV
jgi:hypothetical protein